MTILKALQMRVDTEGTLVDMKLGNVNVKMDHSTALQLAQLLRIHGQRAKAMAGDNSINLTVKGHLTDAEDDILTRQKLRTF
jgi:hypothetical protein